MTFNLTNSHKSSRTTHNDDDKKAHEGSRQQEYSSWYLTTIEKDTGMRNAGTVGGLQKNIATVWVL